MVCAARFRRTPLSLGTSICIPVDSVPPAPNDVIEGNVVDLGIWLHPADYEYEYEQDLAPYPFSPSVQVRPA